MANSVRLIRPAAAADVLKIMKKPKSTAKKSMLKTGKKAPYIFGVRLTTHRFLLHNLLHAGGNHEEVDEKGAALSWGLGLTLMTDKCQFLFSMQVVPKFHKDRPMEIRVKDAKTLVLKHWAEALLCFWYLFEWFSSTARGRCHHLGTFQRTERWIFWHCVCPLPQGQNDESFGNAFAPLPAGELENGWPSDRTKLDWRHFLDICRSAGTRMEAKRGTVPQFGKASVCSGHGVACAGALKGHGSFWISVGGFIEVCLVRPCAAHRPKCPREGSRLASQHLFISLAFYVNSSIWHLAEDLSNQIRHWETYTQAIRKSGKVPGQCLNPLAGEWFSGSHGMISIIYILVFLITSRCQACRGIGLTQQLGKFAKPKWTACSQRLGQSVLAVDFKFPGVGVVWRLVFMASNASAFLPALRAWSWGSDSQPASFCFPVEPVCDDSGPNAHSRELNQTS